MQISDQSADPISPGWISGFTTLRYYLARCDPDRQLLAITARQHGCATVAQAFACGLTRNQVDHRVRTGRFERLGRRVLRIAGTAPSWEQQLTAGVLDLGSDALVSHRAAAALHGFEGFARDPVEFTLPRLGRGLHTSWTVHTSHHLRQIDRAEAAGFSCTSASRTIIDLAASATARELERAIDSAVRDGLTSPTFLSGQLRRLRGPGRAGVRLLDELMTDSGGHSDLERRFLALVRRAGLPRPTCQRIFRRDGTTLARVDFSFEPQPVLAEVSGRRGHASDAERAKDAHRRNELQAEGFIVLEFTDNMVRRRPGYVATTLRRRLT
ncbi:MAG TPA: type IV toxin-antitoxin system AbiEi family antitoxin domain-containing protein [Acidimicrobiales bacterium]|nr:type IV toxin-antitoxin system AbiEi family antitoxin domain-containing protein [Acidimicrobiales bacterium]